MIPHLDCLSIGHIVPFKFSSTIIGSPDLRLLVSPAEKNTYLTSTDKAWPDLITAELSAKALHNAYQQRTIEKCNTIHDITATAWPGPCAKDQIQEVRTPDNQSRGSARDTAEKRVIVTKRNPLGLSAQ